jgi:hypothetical protein
LTVTGSTNITGNVGIGISNPSVKLQVNGVTRFQDPGSNSAIVMTYGTGGWIQVIDVGNTEAIRLRTGGASYINTGQSFLIGTTTDSARLTVKGAGATSSTTALLVQNANASSSLAVLDDGNVGIGTASPAYKLQVVGSAGDIVHILADTGQSAVIGATGVGANRMYIGYSSGAENISITSGGVVRLNSITSGNVLIGTTTDAGYKTYISGTGTLGSFNVDDILHVSGSKVGIGTTSPSASLHISGSSNSILLEVDSPVANNILYVSGSGNVGISTSTPGYKLDVSGSARFTDTLYTNFAVNSATTAVLARGFSDGNFQLVTQNGASVSGYGISTAFGMIYSGSGDVAKINFHRGTSSGTGHISVSSPLKIGDTSATAPAAQFTVKGSGATSSTTALLVQNANASSSLAVSDNGNTVFGSTSTKTLTIRLEDTSGTYGNSVSLRGGNQNGRLEFYSATNVTQLTDNVLVLTSIVGPSIQIGAGGITATPSNGAFAISSTTQGFLQPRVTTTEKNAITSLAAGLQVYDSTINKNSLYNGSTWSNLLTDSGSQSISGSLVIDGGLFDTLSTGSLATGSTLIYSVNTGSYSAGFFDYYAISGSNGRSGTIMSFWLGGQVQYSDNSTPDVGNTSNIAFSMSLAGANAQLFASASSAGWNVKTTFRTI